MADTGSSGTSGSGSSGSSGSVEIFLPVPTPAGMQALSAAMTQIGKPYQWGGIGPNSWDCSGLVRWAFATAGIRLPRTSQQQALVGHAIPARALAPGDAIVFYRNASHIGIYAGFGQVFNAYGPNGVPIGFTPLDKMPPIKTVRRFG
ncbi:NlpC/P60 family protein [Gordonia sp. ABSL1-1]|uniref:C40 family peptidase n=1 Tax=Gordonia sp. ABSL1-1 TaxID=3053923 RepID=UPI002573C39E|nr:NlpC/P60 family protein [Gordonia sp. ABSL1-1]MDL9936198.1 NlpC/P60 family protein [Gordonia sp. ABSL1-1]